MFGFWDCFMELIVNLPVSGIKPIVPGHLEVFFRYMQNEQTEKRTTLHRGKMIPDPQ